MIKKGSKKMFYKEEGIELNVKSHRRWRDTEERMAPKRELWLL